MITSLQNNLVKCVVKLKDRKHRQRENIFLIEGETELRHALANTIEFETLLYCPSIMRANLDFNTPEKLKSCPQFSQTEIIEVTEQVFAKIAYRDQTGGIVALAHTPKITTADISLSDNPFILVVHGVEKPGNLGALLRTADAAGVDAILLCDPDIDLYNPNVIRASLGAIFTVGTVIMSSSDALDWLKKNKINIIVSTPDTTANYCDINLAGATALVVGSEKDGVSDEWLGPDLKQVRIPMYGQMDSLNISCSAAILLYETLRQRGGGAFGGV